jgi:hypothetical protein
MIDHVSLQVRDLKTSAAFYPAALAPLGYTQLVTRAASMRCAPSTIRRWRMAAPMTARPVRAKRR